MKVVIDAGNGAAGPAMHRLLERLNVDATELFFEMDGRFPNHHPDPTVEENLEHLKRAVSEHRRGTRHRLRRRCATGSARSMKTGNVVWGDYLLLIYAREILTRKPGATFIGEVKCSQVMYDEIERLGGTAIMYKTGHSLIKAKMKEEHAELAGEMSGHMFFKDRYFGFDDALYAACRLIEIVADSGKPLSAQTRRTARDGHHAGDPGRYARRGQVRRRRRACVSISDGTHKVVDVDGARVLFDEGWGLVRASNTQPVLVMRFEARTPELLNEYRRQVEAVVEDVKLQVAANNAK